jgi:hypothetical protein
LNVFIVICQNLKMSQLVNLSFDLLCLRSPDNEFSSDKVTSFNKFTSTYRTAIMFVLSVFCFIFGIIHQQLQHCSAMWMKQWLNKLRQQDTKKHNAEN